MDWSKLFKFVAVAAPKGAQAAKTDGKNALINAAIVAGLGFFSAFAGILSTGIVSDPVAAFIAAGTSCGLQFFTSLAVQRGLKK